MQFKIRTPSVSDFYEESASQIADEIMQSNDETAINKNADAENKTKDIAYALESEEHGKKPKYQNVLP